MIGTVLKVAQTLYGIEKLYGAMGGFNNLPGGDADVAHMGSETFFVGNGKRQIGTLQDAQIG
jgi:hypothetical protein